MLRERMSAFNMRKEQLMQHQKNIQQQQLHMQQQHSMPPSTSPPSTSTSFPGTMAFNPIPVNGVQPGQRYVDPLYHPTLGDKLKKFAGR